MTKTKTTKQNITLTTLVLTTLFSGLVLSSPLATADASSTVTISVEVPSACSLVLVNGTDNIENLSASINPGTTGLIGTSLIKALCNDPNGLAVYAVGYSKDTYGETDLIHNTDNTLVIPTGNVSSPTASQWNMTLAAVDGDYAPTISTGFTAPHAVPEVYTKVAYKNTNTDVNSTGYTATGANFTASFNAYIAPNQPAGAYDGKVKFLLVHPNVIDNSTTPPAEADNVLYMQDVFEWGDSLGIHEEAFAIDKRDGKGYTVARLADGNIWMTKNLDHDIDMEYNYTNENTDIGWNATTNSYDSASWHPSVSTHATDDTAWTVSSTAPESYDPGERYWSVDSMAISEMMEAYMATCDVTTFECDESVLADAPDNVKEGLPEVILFEGYGYTCKQGNCDSSVYAKLSEESKAYFDSCTYEPSFDQNSCDSSLMPSSVSKALLLSDAENFDYTYKTNGDIHYHLGNYYNWTAAIAMNDSSSYAIDGALVDQSICPSGWTLPRVGFGEDTFERLFKAYGFTSSPATGDDALWLEPLYFTLSGNWNVGFSYVGTAGFYRSSVVYNSGRSYTGQVYKDGRFDYYSASVRPAGNSIRCIARPVTNTVTLTAP